MLHHAHFSSPLGWMTVLSGPTGLRSVAFGRHQPEGSAHSIPENREVLTQLDEYFQGVRTRFELELDPRGTPFQLAVWKVLARIPYGQVRSYGEVASRVGRPAAARAVGRANHHNPLAIVIPCHRVIGGNGTLTGYAGGLDLKVRLLELEGVPVSSGDPATAFVRGVSTPQPATVLS